MFKEKENFVNKVMPLVFHSKLVEIIKEDLTHAQMLTTVPFLGLFGWILAWRNVSFFPKSFLLLGKGFLVFLTLFLESKGFSQPKKAFSTFKAPSTP